MQVMSIQCPNCGAPLNIEPSQDKVICGSCGSLLQLTTGSSGFPMARLVSIGQDTSFIARTQATERLKKQVEALDEERETLELNLQLPFKPVSKKTVRLFLLLSIAISIAIFLAVENKWFCLAPPFLTLGLFGLIYAFQDAHHTSALEKLQQTYGPKLKAVEQEIFAKQAQLDKLENDLDTIAMSL